MQKEKINDDINLETKKVLSINVDEIIFKNDIVDCTIKGTRVDMIGLIIINGKKFFPQRED